MLLNPGTACTPCNSGVSFDAATTAWVAAVVANGGTVSAGRKTIVDALIVGLKSDSIWTKLDRLYILAAENTQSALTDLVGLTLAVANGTPTFTTDLGYTGTDASSTKYIETSFDPTAGVQYTRNSAHVSAWSNTSAASGGSGGVLIGNENGTSGSVQVMGRYSGNIGVYRINGDGTPLTPASTDGSGQFLANRSSSNNAEAYRNGSSVDSSGALASQALVSTTIKLLGLGANGVGSGSQVAMGSIGASLSSSDATAFYNRLRTYMTAVGVP